MKTRIDLPFLVQKALGACAVPSLGAAVVLLLLQAGHGGAFAQTAALQVPAETSENPLEQTGYSAKSREAHSTIWEKIVYEPSPFGGEPTPRVRQVTELATGLNYKDASGQWLPSRELVEPVEGGAQAIHGQTKLRWANNLADPWPVQIETPDGKTMHYRVLGITASDHTGKSVWIAEVKDSQGYIEDDSTVIYPDCMSGVKCSIRIRYMRAGIEQDLLIEESLEGLRPSDLGLDPKTAALTLVTEFNSVEPPRIVPEAASSAREDLLTDEVIDFGALKMGPGKAWITGGAPEGSAVTVFKQWLEEGGRRFLFEQMAVSEIAEKLDSLPRHEGAALSPGRSKLRHMVSSERTFPEPPVSARGDTSKMRMASDERDPVMLAALRPERALLADFQLLGSSATNYVFTADVTYYASGLVNLIGTTRAEGCSVLKIGTASTAGIKTTNLVCDTDLFAPFMVTAIDENGCGETISGSTGNPTNRWYGNIGIDLSGAPSGMVLSNVFFSHLSNAVAGAGVVLRNCQVVRCKNAFASGSTSPVLENVLLHRLDRFLPNSAAATVTGRHVTAHNVTNFLSNTTGTINLTNCLFAVVGSWQCTITRTNSSAFLASDAGVFQTVGGGAHYLAAESPYRGVGSTNLPAGLLAELSGRTSYPPTVYSNVTIYTDLVLGPAVERNTGPKDIGFLYAPLDYAFGGVHAYANLTFTAGTAVGWFRTTSGWYHAGHGIHMGDQKTIRFEGRADAPCYWVRTPTVQERLNALWVGGYGPGGITGWAWPNVGDAPQLRARFLKTSMLAADGNHWRDDYGRIMIHVSDSEFWGGGMGGYISSYFLTNCLFNRTYLGLADGNSDVRFDIRSCTFIGNQVYIGRNYPVPVSIRDCAFDRTLFPVTDGYAYNPAYSDYDYNAYITGQPMLTNSGPNNVFVTGSFDWQQSWLGNHYLPGGSGLIDAGSISDASTVGMYHHTTQTDQTKEYTSRLDIGKHWIATDGYGNPLDSDGDGVPDYIEDANGNGSVDSGETDWTSASDLGLKVLITRPKSGPLP
jgi:hypothetical protein